ncbi:MAG: CDGSH iron-sulfur domain-containing protein [Actinomycetota bacterium]
MGRPIVSAQVTMDAVMDQVEGWFDPQAESEQHALEELRGADALVLGRETYEHPAAHWRKPGRGVRRPRQPDSQVRASRTLTEPLQWNARLLGGDTADAVARLKDEHAGTLLSYGCGALANHLACHGLVDEVWLHPVVWGDGVRPFHAGALPVRMRLIAATAYAGASSSAPTTAGAVVMTQPGRLVPLHDGPYLVTGAVEIVDADGHVIQPPTDTVCLCRCGRSATKPFCDGSHARHGRRRTAEGAGGHGPQPAEATTSESVSKPARPVRRKHDNPETTGGERHARCGVADGYFDRRVRVRRS